MRESRNRQGRARQQVASQPGPQPREGQARTDVSMQRKESGLFVKQGRRQPPHTHTHLRASTTAWHLLPFKRHISVAWVGIWGIRFSFYLLGVPITYTHGLVVVGGLVMGNGSGTRPQDTHTHTHTSPLPWFSLALGRAVGLQWAAAIYGYTWETKGWDLAWDGKGIWGNSSGIGMGWDHGEPGETLYPHLSGVGT